MFMRLAITELTELEIAVPGAKRGRSLFARLRGILLEKASQRALADLDERLLRDIGVTQPAAASQAHPARWLTLPPLA